MRIPPSLAALALTAALFAQTASTTKQIMDTMAIPDSNALFFTAGKEKPTDQEWAEARKHAVSLVEAGNLLMTQGRIATGKTKVQTKAKAANPAAWNAAAKQMADAGKAATVAIDARDLDSLSGEVGEKIYISCTACHDKYLIK